VRVVYHPRGKDRKVLGTAQIFAKAVSITHQLTEKEAREDGFESVGEMRAWLTKTGRAEPAALNKLTLQWIEKESDK
jgi:hypothetical protein